MAASDIYLPFSKQEQVAQNTYSFYFYRHGFDLHYLPGQYARMILNLDYTDDRGNTRDFTIASSPTETDYLVFTTKLIQSAFKKSLHNLKEGTQVRLYGPMGGFYLDETVPEYVFLAGGVGITTFRSMIRYASDKNLANNITLFSSFATPEEVIYQQELSNISATHPNIKPVFTITHPGESVLPWSGETGRISPELIRKYLPNVSKQKFLIVGPPSFVSDMEDMVSKMGVKDEQIQIENFTGY